MRYLFLGIKDKKNYVLQYLRHVMLFMACYLRIKEVLETSGMLKSKFFNAIFYWLSNKKPEGVLCCHVHNFVWGGSINFEKQCIKVNIFCVSQESEKFKYLGLYNDVIMLHQIPYINELKECDI